MIKQKNKKMLIAIDGSDNALEAVKYVSKLAPFKAMDVTLYNVFSTIPEHYWDMEWAPFYGQSVRAVRSWEVQQKSNRKKYMEQARQTLIQSGFTNSGITIKTHERKSGIARDIINEAKNGYNAVVVGRKGLSRLKDIVLGSVADKLINQINFTSLWVVGDNPTAGKVLIAFDGSEGAMSAVNYVGSILDGSDNEVTLLYVIRGENKTFMEEAKDKIAPMLDDAKNRLIGAGFRPENVKTKIISGVISRAGTIIYESKKEGYGTIVVGRRGLSKVSEFFIGRVSNKVMHMAKNNSVWIVK